MGYISRLAIAVDEPHAGEFKSLVKAIDAQPDEEFVLEDGSYVIKFDGSKWYEEFSDVSLIEEYLMGLDSEEYGYLRIGEESSDVEYKGSPWDFNIAHISYIEVHGDPDVSGIKETMSEVEKSLKDPASITDSRLLMFLSDSDLKKVDVDIRLNWVRKNRYYDKSIDIGYFPEKKVWRELAVTRGIFTFDMLKFVDDDDEKANIMSRL